MKIQRKLLLSYMMIVVLFAAVGVVITLNTMKMNELQINASKQTEIGNYATAYQKGFYMRTISFDETSTNPEKAATDFATGQALTNAAGAYLKDNLPQGSALFTDFNSAYQIDATVIAPALQNIQTAYDAGDIAAVAAQMAIINQAHTDIHAALDNFQLLVYESVEAATAESQAYASFSVLLSATSISAIAAVSVGMAVMLGKRITEPLKKLTTIAGKVSMGELQHEISIKTKDEIADLGEAFQRMINAFKMTSAMNEQEA
jgi:methyl-accepting chemotaxis protein